MLGGNPWLLGEADAPCVCASSTALRSPLPPCQTNPGDIKAGPLPDLDTLETIADWRVDLSTRLKRAQLRHELIGLHPEEIAALGDETPTKEGVNILQQPCTVAYLLGESIVPLTHDLSPP
jgi:hypothetical protein